MRKPSLEELRELSEAYNIAVHDEEASDINELVHGLLTGLDEVNDIPTSNDWRGKVGERWWEEPDENSHNSVITSCEITNDAADGSLLQGIKIGIKDVISVAGIPMSGGSKLLQGHVPSEDATVVKRLLDEGAMITAKTNCDELATSGRGTTSFKGPISNPHDEDRTAGGSSGGSAVTVATGLTDVSLGTDTSGSVQLPAAFCGVIGLKPTYGLVPLSGVIEHAYTMDHVAFFSLTPVHLAAVLEAVAGKDRTDPATLQAAGKKGYSAGGYVQSVQNPLELTDVTFGVVAEGMGDGVRDYIIDQTETAITKLEDAGATIRHVSIEHFTHAKAINENISFTELISHWVAHSAPHRRGGIVNENTQIDIANRMRGSSGELGTYYKAKLLAGAQLIEAQHSRYYTRAQAARETLRAEFDDVLDESDVLLYPTTPGIAPNLNEVENTKPDFARNTRPATVTRLPALTIPNGTHNGLPIGLQLIGGGFEEGTLLGISGRVIETIEG